MGTSVEETIKEIQGRENIFVAYSQTTKLPYVTCGEESFNDQAWFFTEEEAIKEFGKKKIEEKERPKDLKIEKTSAVRASKSQKIKTDTGIEITVPVEYFEDDRYIEFINNNDGTISIALKNIGKLINR